MEFERYQSTYLLFSFSIVRYTGKTGIMFLNEVALGKEKIITRDDSSLRAAPSGFQSVLAKGHTEPGKIL